MKKSPAMTFCIQRMKTLSKEELEARLKNAPITDLEVQVVMDIAHGMTNRELAEKYHVSESRVSSKKRELCELLHRYAMQKHEKKN